MMKDYGVSLRASITGARVASQCMVVKVCGDWEFGGKRSASLRLESCDWIFGGAGIDGACIAGREAM